MRWIHELTARTRASADLIGAKAHGLVELRRLGLPVPAAFVVTTEACRAFLRDGRLPDGLRDELIAATRGLEESTGRRFGGTPPLAVSVRSGASVSMPGMMDTILNLGLTDDAAEALAEEAGDARFALESRLRFLTSFASALTGTDPTGTDPTGAGRTDVNAGEGVDEDRLRAAASAVERVVTEGGGRGIPTSAVEQLELAVETVFASWETPRARTYRELHGIDHEAGTAVVVQVMVFGNRDERSGTGVAFSRNPNTGEPTPFGDVLFAHQGEDVVAGSSHTLPLEELVVREPDVAAALVDALERTEGHCRDAVYVEFTFEAGALWLLQVRPGRFTGAAAIRVAVDLADEGRIGRADALLRVSPQQLRRARTPRIAPTEKTVLLGRGVGACPGVATGRIATTSETARRSAAEGPVILVRPETSPNDMTGIALAAGILTARGGPASHAAVVARSLGKPAVVGLGALTVDERNSSVLLGGRTLTDGALVTIDGTSGEVVLGRVPAVVNGGADRLERLLSWADDTSGDRSEREETERLEAAQAALRA